MIMLGRDGVRYYQCLSCCEVHWRKKGVWGGEGVSEHSMYVYQIHFYPPHTHTTIPLSVYHQYTDVMTVIIPQTIPTHSVISPWYRGLTELVSYYSKQPERYTVPWTVASRAPFLETGSMEGGVEGEMEGWREESSGNESGSGGGMKRKQGSDEGEGKGRRGEGGIL